MSRRALFRPGELPCEGWPIRFIFDADANRIARRPLRHAQNNASGNLGDNAQLGNLPASANNPNSRIFIIEMEQHFEKIAARGRHVLVDVHKRMNVGGRDIGNRLLAAVSVGMTTSVAADNPFAQFPVRVFSVIDLRLQGRSIPDLGRQDSRAHQTLGIVEKLRIACLIQPQRQLRDIAGRSRLAEAFLHHVMARVAGLMDVTWNAHAISGRHPVDILMLPGEPAIHQQAAQRAQVGVRVIGFGCRIDAAVRLCGLGEVKLCDAIR